MSDAEQPSPLCFIDTNIWLYAFIESQDKDKSALAKQVIQQNNIVISTQVINEICVNLIKKAKFDEASLQSLIESFYSECAVAIISREVLLKASVLRQRYQFSFWDSLIVSCALSEGAVILYSEDLDTSLVVENQLRIINPLIG